MKSVEKAIEYFKQGKMVIIVDDEGRENEGDLALPAEDCSPEDINFMATVARGLICTPLDGSIIDNLELEPMVTKNTESMGTAFTVSVDASEDIESGISAKDRSNTVKKLSDIKSTSEDFVKPGHIFPLRYQKGGVLVRAGHTEGSVDLVKLSGKKPAAVICEVMNEDGSMARGNDLKKISEKYNIPIVSIEDIIAYRIANENLVSKIAEAKLATKYGEFTIIGFKSEVDNSEPIALIKGNLDKNETTLVRVHSECTTGDLLNSLRCDCGDQLDLALKKISESESGVLVYMRQEGRGIGLINKIRAYKLQDEGLDTVDANLSLGFPMDLRTYGIGAQILRAVGVKKFDLLTNNPRKVIGLEGFGLEIMSRIQLSGEIRPENKKYIETKKTKMGHKSE
ncbi:MAG: bifunctional 3,4-dihydroxy-2-butanone-4-phosphate synthase/GTP cyclohydrolase II [Chloroflexi bacterium]|nr:bifunctional 3,4-dihydroxy-2-butanone-4-phosphate synthase/GTP cyclohydrolase II [Chloroflexota bacterium]